MKNAKWNKMFLRPLNDEEKEIYGDRYSDIWDGDLPEDGEEVLVYTPKYRGVTTDTWGEFDNSMGFEYIDAPVIYWMSFPEPPRIVSLQ